MENPGDMGSVVVDEQSVAVSGSSGSSVADGELCELWIFRCV